MYLDSHTLMVMIAVLSLMISGLLALAGLHARNVRGIRLWSLASLFISISMGFSILPITPLTAGWWLVLGSVLISTSSALQYLGIRAFMEKEPDWRFPLLVVSIVFSQTVWFSVIDPNIRFRVIANSIAFVAINAASARMLLVPAAQPLRTAYWLTGASFAVISLMLAIRVLVMALSIGRPYTLYSALPVNDMTFFIIIVAELCLSFGFVLMLNYRLAGELQHLAERDALTGAFNRRSLEGEAERMLARAARTMDPLTVMMIDVDHFKAINDTYGHAVGDEVLKRLASIAQKTIRGGDYFARYGGEEFCILLPSVTEDQAEGLAERLRSRYAEMILEHDGAKIRSTISIGIADSSHAGSDFSVLFKAADKALYRAKEEGRNRVAAYSGMLEAAVPA